MASRIAVSIGLLAVTALSGVLWLLSGLFTVDDFMPAAMAFSGVDLETARPIVARLYQVMRLGTLLGPILLTAGFLLFRWFFRNFERIDRWPVFVSVVVGLSLLSFPDPVVSALPGLDNSWQWLLNQLAFTHAFGRETVFTYGPLGFLLCPQSDISVASCALLSNVFYSLLWAFGLLQLYRSSEQAHVAAWLLAATMFFPQQNMEWRWVALAVVLPMIPVAAHAVRRKNLILAGAGAALGLVAFMKFSSLIVGGMAQAACLSVLLSRGRRAPVWSWFASLASVSFLVFLFCYADATSFVRWMAGSWHIASGYNKYMISPKSWVELSVPFVTLGIAMFLLMWRNRRKRALTLVGVVFAPVLFCTVKYALVRQSSYPFFYMFAILMAFATCFAPAARRRIVGFFLVLLFVSLACTLPRAIAGETYSHFPLGINPRGVVRSLSLASECRESLSRTCTNVRACRLPKAWRDKIGSDGVQFLPHEYSPAMGEDSYRIVLLPAFQLYSAYLPSLDKSCGDLYCNDLAPKWIVCSVDPVWSGFFLNYPATWSELFARYQFDDESDGRVLLRRKETELSVSGTGSSMEHAVPTGVFEVRADEWFDCSRWENDDIAIQWNQSIIGRFCSFFLRNTATSVSLRYKEGDVATIPVISENLVRPFPVSRIAVTASEFVQVLRGSSARVPVSMRFQAETPWLYADKILIRTFSAAPR